ncbi:unnamed protein product [Mycena citricolor]|uniref:Uncharacterized protein n=1 Tax=Mycena citricolor TaxID=2018698 RepID=A0AAD2GVQ2_9AGAR|nr:unnamed protein product [Mycena citricolor]
MLKQEMQRGLESTVRSSALQDKKRIYRPGVNSKKLKNSREGGTIYVDGALMESDIISDGISDHVTQSPESDQVQNPSSTRNPRGGDVKGTPASDRSAFD